ncbi:MAG: DUF6148 family protein [Pseudomonadota bacterium]
MTRWKKEELEELLALWKAAYRAASTGQSYTIQGRTLTRYDLPEIRAQIEYLSNQLDILEGKGSGSKRVRMVVRR